MMAKKPIPEKIIHQNISVRKISNGFVVSESKEMSSGRYTNTETFSATNPIKIAPITKKK